MSFHAEFVSRLRADLALALGLPSGAVYVGREPQKVTRAGLEVWIRPQEVEAHGRGGGNQLKVHPFAVHVRLKTRRESSQAGGGQLNQGQAVLDALRERYDGTRPFAADLADLVAVQVEEASVDEDPDEDDLLDGIVVLRVVER